jgi:squalene synthase HpnC
MVTDDVRILSDLQDTPPSSPAAFAHCRRLARTHYENFTLVSWLAPRSMRRHLAALYAYCRTVDDLGDEACGDRLRLLDRWEQELDAAYRGVARHPVMVALQETVARFRLPRKPLERLIQANRMDQQRTRYQSFDDLLHYCAHSATPVGELVLALYGIRDEARIRLSDATCIALQLTNFLQDVQRDAAMDRIYLPQQEMAAFGVSPDDLLASEASPQLLRLMRFQVDRTRGLFAEGLPLLDQVSGHLRVDLALFSRGGLAILHKIQQQGYDTLRRRPTVSSREKLSLAISTLFSRRWTRWI